MRPRKRDAVSGFFANRFERLQHEPGIDGLHRQRAEHRAHIVLNVFVHCWRCSGFAMPLRAQ